MPLTLIPEDGTGRADANVFVGRAEATALLEASPYAAAWPDEDATKQDQCLLEATAVLTRAPWDGVATYRTQALAWPRAWMQTPDGYAIAANLIPLWLKQATARLAAWLAQQATSPWADTGLAPGTRLELPGGLKLTPASGAAVPPDVRALIAPYLRRANQVVRV